MTAEQGFDLHPLAAQDITDIWEFIAELDPLAARRVHQALGDFGAPIARYTPEDFTRPGMVHQIGMPPTRVDILTSVAGLTFPKAWARRKRARSRGEVLFFLSLEDLIKSKKRAGRMQDKLDVSNLEKVRNR